MFDLPYLLPKLKRFSLLSGSRPAKTIEKAWRIVEREIEALERAEQRHVDDRIRIKYYTARRIWPIRDKTVPSVERDKPLGAYKTWDEWFELMFHEPLGEFVERAREQNMFERVRAYEIATYGESSLDKYSQPGPAHEQRS